MRSVLFALENFAKDIYYNVSYAYNKKECTSDILIASFPKSGRTWLRALLAKYFELTHDVSFDVELYHKTERLPSIAFSHIVQSIGHSKNKIVVLMRDPRDTLVSYYYGRSKRGKKSYKKDISHFARSRWGIKRIVHYLNKVKKYKRKNKNIFFINYEDLYLRTAQEMKRLLTFMGVEVKEQELKEAVVFCKFENMKRLEQQGAFNTWRLSPDDTNEPQSFKVRKGKIGGFIDELSQADIVYVNNYLKKHLNVGMKKLFLR